MTSPSSIDLDKTRRRLLELSSQVQDLTLGMTCSQPKRPTMDIDFSGSVRKKTLVGPPAPTHKRACSGGCLGEWGIPASEALTSKRNSNAGMVSQDNSDNELSVSPRSAQFLTSTGHSRGEVDAGVEPEDVRSRSGSVYSMESEQIRARGRSGSALSATIDDQMASAKSIHVNGQSYPADTNDLLKQGQIGSGVSGLVMKMLHRPSNTTMAVKILARNSNEEEMKRVLMELYVTINLETSPHIVQSYGCIINPDEAYICLEMMTTCLGKLLKRYRKPFPEAICATIANALVDGLAFLKSERNIIHRDIKPSNILLDAERGVFKICDFGISGVLVNSQAVTRDAGCTAYMAPERFMPGTASGYDIRSDVWSVGITLVELATAQFPYPNCCSQFEVLSRILDDPPPCLPADSSFSPAFHSFLASCLSKDRDQRQHYCDLVLLPFLTERQEVDVREWHRSLVSAAS